MALTQTDLQAIRTLIKEEVADQLEPIKKTLNDHSQQFIDHSQQLASIQKTQTKHSKELKIIRSALNGTIGHFEQEDTLLKKRLDRVEHHLDLPPIH